MRLSALAIVVVLLLMAACQALGVGLPAGTNIRLRAEGTFVDSLNNEQTAEPATVDLTVQQVAGVLIEHDSAPRQVTPGQDTYIPISIRNTGNGLDAYNLTSASTHAWTVCLIYDDNADGVHQADETTVITTAGLMIADGYSPCFVKVTVPASAVSGDEITVGATSMFDPTGTRASATLSLTIPDEPSVTIASPTTDATYATTSPTLSIAGTASGGLPISTVTWATDQDESGSCTGTTSWAASDIALKPGDNVVTVTATDSSGRTATGTLTVSFSDVGAPVVSITAPTSDATYYTQASTLTISGTASDDVSVATVEWSNSAGGSGTCSGTASWTATDVTLAQGENEITVTATDQAGNTGTDVLRVTCGADVASPTVQITGPTSGETYSIDDPTVTLSGTASDDIAVTSITWSSDKGTSGACSGTSTWISSSISLSVGANVITITANDASGKTSTDVMTVNYTGAHAPMVQISDPTTNAAYSTIALSINLSGTAAHDAGLSTVTWVNNRGGSGTCTGTDEWTAADIPLATGQNVIVITATATTGATGNDTLVVTRMSPEIAITTPTTSASYTTTASPLTIAGTASDDVEVTSVTWSNDRGGSGTCNGTTSWNATGITLALGRNVISITAMDSLGQSKTAVLSVDYTGSVIPQPVADTTAPTVQIASPTSAPACARNCPVVTLSGTCSDDKAVSSLTWANSATGSTGACTLSGTTWKSDEIDLALGSNPITITARDAADNAATASLTVTYVDTTPGDAWKGLAMVSLPIIPDDKDPKAVTGFYQNSWCTFLPATGAYAVYPEAATWLDPAANTPGRGFWAIFENAATPYGTIPAQDAPATIHLRPGWNQIGTPFISPVVWDLDTLTVKETGGTAKPLSEMTTVAAPFVWGWQQDATNPRTGSYYLVCDATLIQGVSNTLQPWRAYWMRAYKECDLIIQPPH